MSIPKLMTPKKIPDDHEEFLKVFRSLCEQFADEEDDPDIRKHAARENLLGFCHAYAYKVNGVEDW